MRNGPEIFTSVSVSLKNVNDDNNKDFYSQASLTITAKGELREFASSKNQHPQKLNTSYLSAIQFTRISTIFVESLPVVFQKTLPFS